MASVSIQVKMTLVPLDQFTRVVKSGSTPLDRVYDKWERRYQIFIRDRFEKAGNGAWPPTKPPRGLPYLIETGQMFNLLRPFILKRPRIGSEYLTIKFGFGKQMKRKHKSSTETRSRTVEQIAMFHQKGTPRMPRRKILVSPDRETTRGMIKDLEEAFKDLQNQTGVG